MDAIKQPVQPEKSLLPMMKRRGFIWPSFEIYGGSAGFYDYGPLGLLLRENIRDMWRSIYFREGFFEIDTPCINPEKIFQASGHIKSFTDLVVECNSCHENFRADHLIDAGESAISAEYVEKLAAEMKLKCPKCGSHDFSTPVPFNLMFRTQIGPKQGKPGYLRPETPQGIFINFQNLKRFYREKLPFGVFQSGRAFRNEISPRQGMLRLREFNLMEAEVFLDPRKKEWGSLNSFRGQEYLFVPREGTEVVTTLDDALRRKFLLSKAHAYFIGLTFEFALRIGLDPERLRFRQHRKDELAHYALDCWDLEALLSSGWTEITGIADRSDYDLRSHQTVSGSDLTCFRKVGDEHVEKTLRVRAERSRLGPVFKNRSESVARAIEALRPDDIPRDGSFEIGLDGDSITISTDYFRIVEGESIPAGEHFFPHVIEPATGLDRVFYSVLEHSFETDGKKNALRLNPAIAPIKVAVFPLLNERKMTDVSRKIYQEFVNAGIEAYYDDAGSIGRRYARMDEIGTPYCITVDTFEGSVSTVTVRDRDTKKQIRVGRRNIVGKVRHLISGRKLEETGTLIGTGIADEAAGGEDYE
ncbi:MAG: glycine--tRNA ligase [Thermoplasmata archaeon]|nr:glycine--tRNA ligase [Candidatus Sysuiplasma jiujiangense]